MTTDAQKRANDKYKRNLPQTVIRFYPSDRDLYEHLQTKENKAGYIKALIRADMEK